MTVSTMYTAEYPCVHRCVVELALDGVHRRFTHLQMRRRADQEHEDAHKQEARVYTPHEFVTVRRLAEVTA